MKPFDIYFADYHWRNRNYGGFYVLIRKDKEDWLCCAIATEDNRFEAFELNQLDADFAATGLGHTSYVFDAELCRIPVGKFRNQKGDLRGNLLKQFRDASSF